MARLDETTSVQDDEGMRPRRVKVSSQMQVRIPAAFYQHYGFGTEALCVPTEHGVEFRPLRSTVDQTADILQSLLDEDVSKDRLLDEYRRRATERLARIVTPEEMEVSEEQIDMRATPGTPRA